MKSAVRIVVACLLLFGALLILIRTDAAPGDLDLSFGQGGKLGDYLTPSGDDVIRAAALQSDGKIVVTGPYWFGGVQSCALARYNTDGFLDQSFGNGGVTRLKSGTTFSCEAIAIQANGKIVAAGQRDSFITNEDFVVVRLNMDGSLDTSFDLDGIVFTTITSGDDRLRAIAVRPDGKILVGGDSSRRYTVARYNGDGSLDTQFGSGGISIIPTPGYDGRVIAMTVQTDGAIVVAGDLRSFLPPQPVNFGAARLKPDGSIDDSFSGDGFAFLDLPLPPAVATDVTVQTDGKIVLGGGSQTINGSDVHEDFTVLRLKGNGTYDTSFDGDGMAKPSISTRDDFANALEIQSDGKILLAGGTRTNQLGVTDVAIVRLATDGSFDTTFNSTGILVSNQSDGCNGYDSTNDLLLQTDGKIVAAGYGEYGSGQNFAIARFNTDGSTDQSFGIAGKFQHDVSTSASAARAIATMPDGRFVVAAADIYEDNSFAVLRYNPDGTNDTSFSSDGKVVTDIKPGNDDARAVAVQADGKILVVGSVGIPNFQPLSSDGGVVRYNVDGSLDTSFDQDGVAIIDRGPLDYFHCVAIQPDGKVLAGGRTAVSGGGQDLTVVRFNTNGTPDTSFGTNGMAVIPISAGVAYGLVIQPDGKIIAAGEVTVGGNVDFALVRLNTNGTPDSTFDGDGIVTTPLLGTEGARAVSIQQDARIVAAGFSRAGLNDDYAVVRYNTDGSLDTTFDTDGKVFTPILNGTDSATSVAIQQNGKMVVGGTSNSSTSQTAPNSEFSLVRYNSDGSLDATFSGDGKIAFDFWGESNDFLSGLVLDSHGRALAVGSSSGNIAIARVLGDFVPNASAPFDFDGDRMTDVGIFRPSVAEWWISLSSNASVLATQFGNSADKIAPVDFTGDGKADIAFWRPSTGEWFVLRSEDYSFFAFPYGTNGDIPAPADYDADGKADAAVFRPSSGTWFIRRSSDGGTTAEAFGLNGDQPVPADYDGDGRTDTAIYRPSNGQWWLNRSTAGVIGTTFGSSSDKPVQGDYTGDGKSDIAFWRPSTGEWFVLRSEDYSYFAFPFGTIGDIPAPGDYDGDGRHDATVFRPSNGTWYSHRTTAGFLAQQFGSTGDQPLANAFVR